MTAAPKLLTGKNQRWQMVALLSVAFALCYVDRQAAFSIFPVLKKELGFSDTQLGLVGSLFGWSYALSMPGAGRIADLVRRDWLVIASLVLWSLATLGTAFSNSPTSFLVWRVVMGLTESLYFPAALGIRAVLHPRINPLPRVGYSSGGAVGGHYRWRVVRGLGGREHRLENGLRRTKHHRHRLLGCSHEVFSRKQHRSWEAR